MNETSECIEVSHGQHAGRSADYLSDRDSPGRVVSDDERWDLHDARTDPSLGLRLQLNSWRNCVSFVPEQSEPYPRKAGMSRNSRLRGPKQMLFRIE